MDHHCPWLATCVGLHNYKAFILFLIYTSVFCWVCFGTGALWTYYEILTDTQYTDSTTPVNVILVTIIGGIIGLVLSGFTAWHLSLAFRNLTTIEALEKTRYLSPLRKTLDRRRFEHPLSNRALGELGPGDQSFADRLQDFGNQIIEAHANAIPGVTRAEEGEERPSPSVQNRENERMDGYFTAAELARSRTPAQQSLIQNYGDLERQREIERYEQYLDEQDSEKMPNAFDLGWRQNFVHLFGKNPFLWAVPVCNTIGDGWYWEANPKFLEARERIHKKRLQEWRDWSTQHHQQDRPYNGKVLVDNAPFPPRNEHRLQTSDRPSTGNTAVSMKTLRPSSRTGAERNSERITSRESSPNYDTDSDEEPLNDAGRHQAQRHSRHAGDGRSKADRVLGRTPNRVAEEWRDWD
jgi:palmitoyltransferase ZDHHC2/15/20